MGPALFVFEVIASHNRELAPRLGQVQLVAQESPRALDFHSAHRELARRAIGCRARLPFRASVPPSGQFRLEGVARLAVGQRAQVEKLEADRRHGRARARRARKIEQAHRAAFDRDPPQDESRQRAVRFRRTAQALDDVHEIEAAFAVDH